MINTRLGKRIRYEEIFDEIPKTKLELLNGIGKKVLLKSIPSLITAVKQPGYETAHGVVSGWLQNQPHLRDSIISKLSPQDRVLNISSSLAFAEFVLLNSEQLFTEQTKNEEEIVLSILKTYLLFNTDQENAEKGLQLIQSNLLHEPISTLVVSMNFHEFELQNYELVDILISELGKSIEFFKYLESTESLNQHLKTFLEKYKSESWHQWLTKYLPLIAPVVTEENFSFNDLHIKKDDDYERNSEFLSLFSTEVKPRVKPDYIALRSNPLIRIDDSTFRIISKQFILEKLYKSIQFEFSRTINDSIDEQYKIADFRATHCDEFSEQTLAYKFIADSFPNKWIKKSGNEFKQHGYEGEPDFYLRFKNKVLIFESKDVILTGNEKQSRSSTTLNKALKKKFYKIESAQGIIDQKKAVLQIIETIKSIFNLEYDKIDNYNPDNIRIYPILLTHDRSFNSLGVNQLINSWFEDELQSEFNQTQLNRIGRITVLDISSLIMYHEILKSRKVKLEMNIINQEQEK